MTDLEGRNFRLAGWIAEPHTKGTGFYRTGLFLSINIPEYQKVTQTGGKPWSARRYLIRKSR
jgi:hypothetical protein